MGRIIVALLIASAPALCPVVAAQSTSQRQSEQEDRVKKLESDVNAALKLLERTQAQVESLTAEVKQLKAQLSEARSAGAANVNAESAKTQTPIPAGQKLPEAEPKPSSFAERITAPGLGEDERKSQLRARPEVFIQTRYSTLPHKGATIEDFESNFRLSRIETRWSGRINGHFGAGLEIQFQPALEGRAEELVNDAFIEYYPNDHATLKVGQFIKPFGFDIQQSSAVRESPERAMFAGYFFPGQRDRGLLVQGDLDFLSVPVLKNIQYFAAALNGNRFFIDNNRQLNYLFRVRKRFDSINLTAGASVQLGKQLLPPGEGGNNDENVFGADFQYVRGRFGLRGEFVAGNTPSTLLGLEPRFTPRFRPGRHSSGGALFTTYQLTGKDGLYARHDQFNGDPVTGLNVRAFNFGYIRYFNEFSRIGIDYQFKNRLSFNDDVVNTRLQLTWGITF